MTSIRLLPVVIAAALALLLFKGVGLLTGSGYVLTGEVLAATAESDHGTVATGTETTMELPPEPTMVDDNPTISDTAPTIGADDADAHGAPAADHGTAEEHATDGAEPAEDGGEPAPVGQGIEPAPEDHAAAPAAEDHAAPPPGEHGAPEVPDLDAAPAEDPRAESTPMFQDETGAFVPLTSENGGSLTETVILERLSARRAELDAREEELALRLQLVEAAEAQLEERAAALAEVEARITALLDQQKAEQEGQFAAIINMYEQMKPTEAAAIFNDLDMQVLTKVAEGMNPRKMAPILAKMNSVRAQQLTLALAAVEPTPVAAPAAPPGEDLSSLPQIVGQ